MDITKFIIRNESGSYDSFICKNAEINFETALFMLNVPIELRMIILDYYGKESGFAEHVLYNLLLHTSKKIRELCSNDNITLNKNKKIYDPIVFTKFIEKTNYTTIRIQKNGEFKSIIIYPLFLQYMYNSVLKNRINGALQKKINTCK